MLGVVRLPGVNAAKMKTDGRQREGSSEKCSHNARFMPVNEGCGRLTASRLVVFYEVDKLIVRRDNDSSKNTKPT